MAAGIDLHPTRPMSFEPLDTGPDQNVGRLLVTCEDRPGICAAIPASLWRQIRVPEPIAAHSPRIGPVWFPAVLRLCRA